MLHAFASLRTRLSAAGEKQAGATQSPPASSKSPWKDFLLALDIALELPPTLKFLPMLFAPATDFWLAIPTLPQLLAQLAVLLVVDFVVVRWLPVTRFLKTTVGPDPAFSLSLEFMNPRLSLFVVTAALSYFTALNQVWGSVNLMAVMAWLEVRRWYDSTV